MIRVLSLALGCVAALGVAASGGLSFAEPAAAASEPEHRGPGRYVIVDYPASKEEGKLRIAVTYTLWIPDGVKTLRGIIVHQHGAGTTASQEGSTAAYDLHWQALARKWECALLGSSYHVRNDGDWGEGGSGYWVDPRRGSDKTFLTALDDLAAKAEHPELKVVPWALWGHSAGGIWSDLMSTLHPDRVVAVYFRSGTMVVFRDRAQQIPPVAATPAVYAIPMMCSAGVREKWLTDTSQLTFKEHRAMGAPIGYATDPKTDHDCGDSRYMSIPFMDACLAMRLPEKGAKDQTLRPVDQAHAWLATLDEKTAVPAAEYKGDASKAVWLPNEAVARAWMEYVSTGATSDTTPPAAPYSVRFAAGEQGTTLTWNADADFESGIGEFVITRDGQELAKVPEKPVNSYGRPLFQGKTYHDTPAKPLREMKFTDAAAKAGENHVYKVVSVNSVGLKSDPSEAAKAIDKSAP
jgi:hypothetical protein